MQAAGRLHCASPALQGLFVGGALGIQYSDTCNKVGFCGVWRQRRLRIRTETVKVRLLSYKEIKCTDGPSALAFLAGRWQSLVGRASSGCCSCWAPDWYLGVRKSWWKQWKVCACGRKYCFSWAPRNKCCCSWVWGLRVCREEQWRRKAAQCGLAGKCILSDVRLRINTSHWSVWLTQLWRPQIFHFFINLFSFVSWLLL